MCWVTKAAAMTLACGRCERWLLSLDQGRPWPELGRRVLRALALNEPNDLIDWAQAATKTQIANLAVEVFGAWDSRDRIAAGILAAAATQPGARRRHLRAPAGKPGTPVRFVLAGSILLKQPRFGAQVGREVRKLWPKAVITPTQARECVGRGRIGWQGRRAVRQSDSPKSTVHGPRPGAAVGSGELLGQVFTRQGLRPRSSEILAP